MTVVGREWLFQLLKKERGSHPRTEQEIEEFLSEFFSKKPAERLDDLMVLMFDSYTDSRKESAE